MRLLKDAQRQGENGALAIKHEDWIVDGVLTCLFLE